KLRWLAVIPLVCLQMVFNTGIVFIVSRITVHIRDWVQIVPNIVRILFFSSGILFDVERLHGHNTLVEVVKVTPFYAFVALGRQIVLGGRYATHETLLVAFIWSVVVLPVGFVYFWRAEQRYGRD